MQCGSEVSAFISETQFVVVFNSTRSRDYPKSSFSKANRDFFSKKNFPLSISLRTEFFFTFPMLYKQITS